MCHYMIPKTIHYCWFGRNKKSPLIEMCIDSWKKYCPNYGIKEWNEDNFDINQCQFVKEAYATKKWAFVSDYARLYILKEHGGIYMDTDVEVIKPLDRFLVHPAFSGFENDILIPTGIIGAETNNPWISYLLTYYDNRRFIRLHGKCDMTANVEIITRMTAEKYDFKPDNTYQELEDVVLYPKEYFCPKEFATKEIKATENTYAIHHFYGSWLPKNKKDKDEFNSLCNRIKRLILKVKLKTQRV